MCGVHVLKRARPCCLHTHLAPPLPRMCPPFRTQVLAAVCAAALPTSWADAGAATSQATAGDAPAGPGAVQAGGGQAAAAPPGGPHAPPIHPSLPAASTQHMLAALLDCLQLGCSATQGPNCTGPHLLLSARSGSGASGQQGGWGAGGWAVRAGACLLPTFSPAGSGSGSVVPAGTLSLQLPPPPTQAGPATMQVCVCRRHGHVRSGW